MNNDRFKFRVWDKDNECYVQDEADWCYLKFDGTIDCGSTSDFETVPEWHLKQENAVIEQCTGLKDKNGKLIFEGDVVDYYDPMADDHYQGVVTFDDNETTASGYYIKGNRKGRWDSYLDGSHCRIIGNVHDNEVKK